MQIDDAQAQTWFPRLDVRGQKLTPPMPDPSELLTESTQRRFADGMAPDGTSWVLMRGQSCLCGSEWWRQRLFAADHGGAVRLSRQHGDASMRPRLFAADHSPSAKP